MNMQYQIDSMAAQISAFADEIEVPFDAKSQIDQLQKPTVAMKSTCLMLPAARQSVITANKTVSSAPADRRFRCYFKTRSNALKQYQLNIVDGNVTFSRPGSSKQSEISYALNNFQCVVKQTVDEVGFITAAKKKMTVSANFCLAFIMSASQLRFVYFDDEETLTYWHT